VSQGVGEEAKVGDGVEDVAIEANPSLVAAAEGILEQ
jgi:hypothetical protein